MKERFPVNSEAVPSILESSKSFKRRESLPRLYERNGTNLRWKYKRCFRGWIPKYYLNISEKILRLATHGYLKKKILEGTEKRQVLAWEVIFAHKMTSV